MQLSFCFFYFFFLLLGSARRSCSAETNRRTQRRLSCLLLVCVYVCVLGVSKKSQQETKNVLYVRIKEKSQNLLQIGILRNCRKNVAKQSTQ